MDELRAALQHLSTQLNEAIERARRAGYLARRLGVSQLASSTPHVLPPLRSRQYHSTEFLVSQVNRATESAS
jgi:hypothetical protein